MDAEFRSRLVQFDPGEKELVMRLDSYCCYKERTGICSLDLPDSNLPEAGAADLSCSTTREYCRELYQSFLEKGIRGTVYIGKNACGHYDIDDGQHRLCIAKQKGLVAPAHVSENKGNCNYCLRLEKSMFHKIKSLFVKNLRVEQFFIKK